MRYSKPCKTRLAMARDFKKIDWDKWIPDCTTLYMDRDGDSFQDAQAFVSTEYYIAESMHHKKWRSIYIDSLDLMDFLCSPSVATGDEAAVAKAVASFAEDSSAPSGIMIHMPRQQTSLYVCVMKVGDKTLMIMCSGPIAGAMGFPIEMRSGTFLDFLKGSQEWRIIVNLFMYMDAFPDSVRSGVPALNSKGSRPLSIDSSFIVSASSAIRDTYANGITPHMRRGHFRLLQSEKFKNKRGQTVYVKPSMVAGRAETVISKSGAMV